MANQNSGARGRDIARQNLLRRARSAEENPAIPDLDELARVLREAAQVLCSLPRQTRPPRSSGEAGGLLFLPLELPVLILPDLHARPGLLRRALEWVPPEADKPLVDLLMEGGAVLLCLGDIFHSEGPDAPRHWLEAYREYLGGFLARGAMDAEMGRGLGALEILARAICLIPGRVFCLKGNHDNSRNRDEGGDHGFYKFADEGAMCKAWFESFAGGAFREALIAFEEALPIAALGKGFAASHAEPAFPVEASDIIERSPDVVEALIWTANGEAIAGSVAASLRALLGRDYPEARWITGHRPVKGRYARRADGLLVQIHASTAFQGAWLLPDRPFDPERDVWEL